MRSPRCSANSKPAKAAFSLIELLVVGALLAIVIAAIGACLAGGIRVWDAARRFDVVEGDAALALDLMARDIRNALTFNGVPFEAEPETIGFAGVVRGSEGGFADEGEGAALGSIAYRLDGAERALMRVTAVHPDGRERAEPVADAVAALRFLYTWPPRDDGASPSGFPVTVTIRMTVGEERDATPFERLVTIPIEDWRP